MSKDRKTGRNIKIMMYMALLTALQIILTRLFVLDLGPYRIAFGNVAAVLAGLWLGPAAGGICSFAADILGCFLKGFAVNPLITAAAILWGVIPAAAMRLFPGRTKTRKTVTLCVSIAITGMISSIILTTAGLVLFLGYSLYAILPGRLIQSAVLIPCCCILTWIIYSSPVTSVIASSLETSAGAASSGRP